MKEEVIGSILTALFLSALFCVPVGIITADNEVKSFAPQKQTELAQAPVVLFDESHDPAFGFTHDVMLANMTTDLEAHGYTVENMTSWNEEMLFSANVVIIAVPSIAYSIDEFYTLHRFVAKGGGLFIIGDVPSNSQADELSEEFGFYFSPNALEDLDDFSSNPGWIRWTDASNFATHPITEGVSDVTTYLGHGIRNYLSGGVPLLKMDVDENSVYQTTGDLACGTAAFVALEYPEGMGRIVVSGDSNMFWSLDFSLDGEEEYFEGDNDLLARNIIDWLASAPIPQNVIVFDKTHNAQRTINTYTKFIDVLFDETQNPMWGIDDDDDGIYGYSDDFSLGGDFASFLEGNSMDVEKMDLWEFITLASADIIVLANPSTTFSQSEIDHMVSKVRYGAGLLLLGEAGPYLGAGTTQLAQAFGVEFYDGGLNDTDDHYAIEQWIKLDGNNLADHPIFDGVQEVCYMYGGGFKTVPYDSVVLLSTDDDSSSGWTLAPPESVSPRDVPLAITFKYGEGNVMMIAESNLVTSFVSNEFLRYGNTSLFAINAIRWLAEESAKYSYWKAAQDLRNQGYGVISMVDFNESYLEDTDALVLPVPVNYYSAAEKSIIDDYVTIQGNGLFLIGDIGTHILHVGDIAADYGIIFDSAGQILEDHDDNTDSTDHDSFLLDDTNIRTHAITEGVEDLFLVTGTGIVNYPENAEVILEMDDDMFSDWSNGTPAEQVALMIALEVGEGRIVAIGDSTFWQGQVYLTDIYGDKKTLAIDELDNALIMSNAISWLIGEQGPITPFELPWWALPALGGVVVLVIVGVGFGMRSRRTETTTTKTTTKKKTTKKTKK